MRRTETYGEIKRLWILETANEAREDLQDSRDAAWIRTVKNAAEKIIALMRKAASGLETMLAALRRPKERKVV